jgi:hypothetical protein
MIKQFKIRCSGIGHIMGLVNRPTEIQLNKIVELQSKPKLTELQAAELARLIEKRDAPPQLSDGGKTYCENWLKEQLYGRQMEFSSKYTEKGNACEPAGIDLTAKMMHYDFVLKNEEFYEDDYMTGTPDIVLADIIEDIKNSWSCFTFPLFDTELPKADYYYQLQGYMHLTGRKKAAVNYVLIDAPDEIIDKETRSVWFKAGNEGDIDMECHDEVRAKMTYADVPDELRFKRFEFDYNEDVIKTIQDRVLLCREYINSLLPKYTK